MSELTEMTIQREITISASPKTVWGFLVDAEKATRWMGTAATFDPVVGGEYRVEVVPGNAVRGKFLEIDEPRRLVHTWGWEPGSVSPVLPGSTTVEYELIPDGEHTIVRLTNSELPTLESVAQHTLGWEHYLGRLQIASAGGDAGRDPWVDSPPS